MSKIYVASSWRCVHQPGVVRALREAGHEVYDFRHPRPGDDGFAWSEVDPAWKEWTAMAFRAALDHPISARGFALDYEAMLFAEVCVLVLPCGRSAHLEAGWFAGHDKPLHIYIPERCEPELMYRMADSVSTTMAELLEAVLAPS